MVKKKYRRKFKKYVPRNEGAKAILAALKEGSLLTLELLDLVFGAYQRSYRSAHSALYGGSAGYYKHKEKTPRDIEFEEQQTFYSLLNRLKRQGFVSKKQSKYGTAWKATKQGLKKLFTLQNKKQMSYAIKPEKTLKIVSYDIPEWMKKKREWLREALEFLGFRMLHKSVWIGKNQIPEEFLHDLKDGELLNHIHIFEVGARGTIKEL